jgi:hypothetical protein
MNAANKEDRHNSFRLRTTLETVTIRRSIQWHNRWEVRSLAISDSAREITRGWAGKDRSQRQRACGDLIQFT